MFVAWCLVLSVVCFRYVVGVASCLGVVLILLFRIPASLPPDPDTCCPVGVCLCVPVLYLHSNMKGEPNSEK